MVCIFEYSLTDNKSIKYRGVAGNEILVGHILDKTWQLGGALLHKFPNIGMAAAIPAIPPATSLQISIEIIGPT